MTRKVSRYDDVDDASWSVERYPHPLASCMMPVLAILVLIVLGIGVIWYWQQSLPGSVSVPAIIGKDRVEAVQRLEAIGLIAEVIEEKEPSEEFRENTVISTSPTAGQRIKVGRTVRMQLSAGSRYTRIPEVRNLSKVSARARLAEAGLLVDDEEYEFDARIARDAVINVSPIAGTKVARQSGVKLKISRGAREDDITNGIGNRMHISTLTVTLPDDGADPKEVRIEVSDDNGTQTVYRNVHSPGDVVVYTVEGIGPSVADVYFGTRRVKTQPF